MLSIKGRNNSNCFVIFCMPRTGSYHLVSLLQSANDIYCLGEIFKPNSIELPTYDRKRMTSSDINGRNAAPLAYISELRKLHQFRHFGFKLFPDHISRVPAISQYLYDPTVKRIILFRNPLSQYASFLEAKKTGIWTRRINSGRPRSKGEETSAKKSQQAAPKVHFDPRTFSAFASGYNAFMESLFDFADDSNTHFVFYEKINDVSVRARILEHVGSQIAAEEMSSDLLPQNPKPVDERVQNWSEMTEFILHRKPFRNPPTPVYSKLGDLNSDTIDNAVRAAV